MNEPSQKQPNHWVKLHLTLGFWASPYKAIWAVSELLELANTFILPLKFYICLLCNITVPLVNWHSGLESACDNPIWFKNTNSHQNFFHILKASTTPLFFLQMFQRKGHELLMSQFKWIFHIQRLPSIIFTVSLKTTFICVKEEGTHSIAGENQALIISNKLGHCYMPRVPVTCHISSYSSKSSPSSLCSITRGVLAIEMQHSSCDFNFTVE